MRTLLLVSCLLMTHNAFAQTAPRATPAGKDFLKALSFAQHFGKPAALTAENDRHLKTALLKALQEKPPTLSFDEVKDMFGHEGFGQPLTIAQIEARLIEAAPKSRGELIPDLREHIDLLTTQLDMIDGPHQRASNELAGWIGKNYSADGTLLRVSVICTGNSRRSVMGSVMGNVAAAYWGMPNIKFYSGGTAPSAFNVRTIEALRQIHIEVGNTGEEALRGKAGEPNPVYWVDWGRGRKHEFSKLYTHEQNPQKDFAAILVCDEADEACPTVAGASIRISAPYFDPKAYDGSALEAAKYAERRDDIGRMMLSALMQARRQIATKK